MNKKRGTGIGKFRSVAKNRELRDKTIRYGKHFGFLTEEQRKLHEEFTQCQNWDEVEAFLKKVEKLKESRENNEIPHLDMTSEEFCKNTI